MNPKYVRNPSGLQQAFPEPGCFLKGWDIYNGTGAVIFVQVFGAESASVTPGATAPLFVIPVDPGRVSQKDFSDEGIELGAFSYIVTTEDDNSAEPSPGTTTDTIDVTFYTK